MRARLNDQGGRAKKPRKKTTLWTVQNSGTPHPLRTPAHSALVLALQCNGRQLRGEGIDDGDGGRTWETQNVSRHGGSENRNLL